MKGGDAVSQPSNLNNLMASAKNAMGAPSASTVTTPKSSATNVNMSTGGKRKSNGHKGTCRCPICNNMKKSMRKGGMGETDDNEEETFGESTSSSSSSSKSGMGGRRRTRKSRKSRKSRRTRRRR
jgi:hypothetical protein